MFLKAQCREAAMEFSRGPKATKQKPLTKRPPGIVAEVVGQGVYALPILVREAFEAPGQQARIPAQLMRERLANLTEPARGFPKILRKMLSELYHIGIAIDSWEPPSPMSVEDACHCLGRKGQDLHKDIQRFLRICQDYETKNGQPCLIEVMW